MNTVIGLLIIAIGAFCQSSSYVPINKIRQWSWESYWLVQGVFAWLVFPLLGALLAVPAGHGLFELYAASPKETLLTMFFGLSLGRSFFAAGSAMDTLAFCILMALNVTFSNVWGIILKEWKGCSRKTIVVLIAGIAVLILSSFLPELLK